MAKLNELDTALRHFAETYHAGVVGSEWDEACDYAESVANRFRWQGTEVPRCDRAVADHLYGEACRYANM
jgi:hypothetical protein